VQRPTVDENPGEVQERDEGDNTYEKTITVKSSVVPNMVFDKPTGRVERLSISKTRGTDDGYPLTSSNKLYVSWSVQNNGGSKTPGKVTVRLYVDGSLQKSWSSAASMKPSKRWEKKDQPIGKLLFGEHEIKLVVDAGIPVPETNKGDNEVVKKINIQKDPVGIGKPTLRGPDSLTVGQEGPYQIQGVASACANGMEYYVNWGDGRNTGCVAWGQVSHTYLDEGIYAVSAKMKCAGTTIESEEVSTTLFVLGAGVGGDD
jgi:subtilase family serine protease